MTEAPTTKESDELGSLLTEVGYEELLYGNRSDLLPNWVRHNIEVGNLEFEELSHKAIEFQQSLLESFRNLVNNGVPPSQDAENYLSVDQATIASKKVDCGSAKANKPLLTVWKNTPLQDWDLKNYQQVVKRLKNPLKKRLEKF